ncbi:hypothetical protein CERZMDRAFT_100818 [Cercospora zeae-maydis SCOH1-5]|uniref:Uncharacterized protein n=1 Tax=Cercospora zeae-maydis SCOH1-5 TaxID=717836 RepID=A0A6A6F3M7_9PEZI|nr:hypothetical protein CERZMDRAFT_100818 [Cercospora zeae-maydis SCOH1-5]
MPAEADKQARAVVEEMWRQCTTDDQRFRKFSFWDVQPGSDEAELMNIASLSIDAIPIMKHTYRSEHRELARQAKTDRPTTDFSMAEQKAHEAATHIQNDSLSYYHEDNLGASVSGHLTPNLEAARIVHLRGVKEAIRAGER